MSDKGGFKFIKKSYPKVILFFLQLDYLKLKLIYRFLPFQIGVHLRLQGTTAEITGFEY